jgi:hypothetical protein
MAFTDNVIIEMEGGNASMSVPDRSIDSRLLSAARKEFL